MPLLSQLREITTPVEIRRGALTFTLNVALEKFTPEEGEYKKLRLEMVDIAFRKQQLRLDNERLMVSVQEASDLTAIRFDLEEQNGLTDDRARIIGDESLDQDAKVDAIEKAELEARERVTDDMVNKEFDRRVEVANKGADENAKSLAEADTSEHRNVAARLAYLVASTDIVGENDAACLSGAVDKTPEELEADTDFFFKNFSVKLLVHCLEKVEQAVYGPLETASNSGV